MAKTKTKTKTGEAISSKGRSPSLRKQLRKFIRTAVKEGDLACWRRGKAVLGYIEGRRVIELADELDTTRGSVNRWLQAYEAEGVEGLRTGKPPGRDPRLNVTQREELANIIENGPLEYGYQSGVWTGPMIGDLIEAEFGVRYHTHYVPTLLHDLGFSVQRPRKRLAKADKEEQDYWIRKKFPEIKKSQEVRRGGDVRG